MAGNLEWRGHRLGAAAILINFPGNVMAKGFDRPLKLGARDHDAMTAPLAL
jgi:hypothetical protein